MKKLYCILFLIIFSSQIHAQNDNLESKLKTNLQVGYYSADWYKFSKEGKFIEIGVGFKINADFWLNLNVNYSEGKGPNDPYLNIGDNPKKTSQFTVAPIVSKYYCLTDKLDVSGKVGPYVSFQSYYDYVFLDIVNYTHSSYVILGAVVGVDFDYKVSKNVSVGVMSSYAFELSYGYSGLYIGPKVEWMF